MVKKHFVVVLFIHFSLMGKVQPSFIEDCPQWAFEKVKQTITPQKIKEAAREISRFIIRVTSLQATNAAQTSLLSCLKGLGAISAQDRGLLYMEKEAATKLHAYFLQSFLEQFLPYQNINVKSFLEELSLDTLPSIVAQKEKALLLFTRYHVDNHHYEQAFKSYKHHYKFNSFTQANCDKKKIILWFAIQLCTAVGVEALMHSSCFKPLLIGESQSSLALNILFATINNCMPSEEPSISNDLWHTVLKASSQTISCAKFLGCIEMLFYGAKKIYTFNREHSSS